MGPEVESGPRGHHPNYLVVWICLVVLAVGSVLFSRLDVPVGLLTFVIYVAAAVKMALIGLYFMHLRTERPLVLALVAAPLTLIVVLLVALLPDFVIG